MQYNAFQQQAEALRALDNNTWPFQLEFQPRSPFDKNVPFHVGRARPTPLVLDTSKCSKLDPVFLRTPGVNVPHRSRLSERLGEMRRTQRRAEEEQQVRLQQEQERALREEHEAKSEMQRKANLQKEKEAEEGRKKFLQQQRGQEMVPYGEKQQKQQDQHDGQTMVLYNRGKQQVDESNSQLVSVETSSKQIDVVEERKRCRLVKVAELRSREQKNSLLTIDNGGTPSSSGKRREMSGAIIVEDDTSDDVQRCKEPRFNASMSTWEDQEHGQWQGCQENGGSSLSFASATQFIDAALQQVRREAEAEFMRDVAPTVMRQMRDKEMEHAKRHLGREAERLVQQQQRRHRQEEAADKATARKETLHRCEYKLYQGKSNERRCENTVNSDHPFCSKCFGLYNKRKNK
jgi:hypothetical protein